MEDKLVTMGWLIQERNNSKSIMRIIKVLHLAEFNEIITASQINLQKFNYMIR